MYSVFIGDDNVRWLDTLAVSISNDPEFSVVAKAKTGAEAITLLERFRPDIVILDVIMPEFDGVYIVKHIRKNMDSYHPIIYILTGMGTDNIIAMFHELEVDYYNLKPTTPQIIIETLHSLVRSNIIEDVPRISETSQIFETPQISDQVIKKTMLSLGIPPHRMSFECTKDAIRFVLDDPSHVSTLTKVIYPQIAEKHQISVPSVEKNIRNAVALMEKSHTELYEQIFSYKSYNLNKKITNGEFLSIVTDYINNHLSL